MFVADSGGCRVLGFVAPLSDDEAASLVIGQPNFATSTCATTASNLFQPAGVALDGSGNLWVADYFNDRVVEYIPPFSNGMSASLVLGQPNFTTAGCTHDVTASSLCAALGVAFDGSGDLWVVNEGFTEVLEYTPPFSNGMSPSLVIGQPNFTTHTGCNLTVNGLCEPGAVAFDGSGNLWVADSFNDRVLEYTPPFSNGMDASLVIGQPNFTTGENCTGNLTLTASGLCNPVEVAFDGSGNLWVSDGGYDRVLEYTPPFSNGMDASLVIGQPNFTSVVNYCITPPPTASGLCGPHGLAAVVK